MFEPGLVASAVAQSPVPAHGGAPIVATPTVAGESARLTFLATTEKE